MLLVYLKRRCYPLFSSKFLIGQLYSNWPGSSSRTVIIFQFKLLHRCLAANDFRNKIGITENICTFCKTEKESLFHLHVLPSCKETCHFWQGFMKWLAENQIKL